jgi:N-methylhydantoinase A
MGGTSLDVCLIRDGEIPTTTESWVGEERVAIKMVDIHSAGAGGGSIAWIDSLGLLRVGPHSAGAEPGPACYGRGGKEPTVTDADLLLGYVPADFFLGGEIELARDKAEEAVKKVAQPLGMTVAQAAQAIFTTVNSFMADQITEVSTKLGYDVRDFALVVGGGAGPVHGAAIAELLSIPAVLIPSVAAAYSAFGMFAMDVGRNYARSYICGAKHIDIEKVNRLYGEMEAEAVAGFRANGIAAAEIVFRRSAEMRYGGQFHEVEVELSGAAFTAQRLEATVNEFHRQHEKLYTFRMPWKAAEFLTFRLRATAPRAPFHLRQIDAGGPDGASAIKRRRRCWFEGREIDTPVYDGTRLLAGARFSGPAIIEETTTTVVIPARFECAVDQWKNYLLTRVEKGNDPFDKLRVMVREIEP